MNEKEKKEKTSKEDMNVEIKEPDWGFLQEVVDSQFEGVDGETRLEPNVIIMPVYTDQTSLIETRQRFAETGEGKTIFIAIRSTNHKGNLGKLWAPNKSGSPDVYIKSDKYCTLIFNAIYEIQTTQLHSSSEKKTFSKVAFMSCFKRLLHGIKKEKVNISSLYVHIPFAFIDESYTNGVFTELDVLELSIEISDLLRAEKMDSKLTVILEVLTYDNDDSLALTDIYGDGSNDDESKKNKKKNAKKNKKKKKK